MTSGESIDLQTLANLAEVIGVLTVIGGVGFAMVQLRLANRQRRDSAAIGLVRIFQSENFIESLRKVHALPDGVSAQELRAREDDAEARAMTLGVDFENVGLLVFRRVVSFDVVEELVGGVVVFSWRKLENWVSTLREEQGQESMFEWFEWLADRLVEAQQPGDRVPAQRRYANWRP